MRVGEAAGRRQRRGAGGEQLDPLIDGSGLRQQAQRAGEPSRRGRRRALRGLPAGLGQRGHGGRVADLGGGVDVVGASQGAGATVGEGLGDALVRSDAPGGR